MRVDRIALTALLTIAFVSPAKAGKPEFVQVSPGVYMVTVKNYAGVFANAATTKRKAILAANEFAESKGMQAVPVNLESVPARPGPGGWPYVEYQFRLVPKGATDTIGLRPDAAVRMEVSGAPQAPAPMPPAAKPDLYGELLKLDDLRKRGLLTEAEFETQKAKLLGQ
jgi:hypothetical protein